MRSRVLTGIFTVALAVGPLTAAQAVRDRPAPDLVTTRKPPSIQHVDFVLPNGLRVFIIPDHATPTVAIVTYYRVGSKDERPGKTGFAHLFEHMMFKGSAHVPDGQMDVMFEGAGGWTNAFTSTDQTVYQDLSSAAFLEPALWLEADRLAGLTDTLDQAKLDNQREVVRNERRQSYENQPYGEAWLLISKALWPEGHGYHWDTIGSHEDLVAASTGDVKAFFKNFYVPRNAVLVIAGDVDPARTKALVEKYLGWIPGGDEPKRPSYKIPAPITKEVRIESKDDVQVPRVYVSWRGPSVFTADEAPLEILASLLGDGKNSRLYKSLVFEQRLAQDVTFGIDKGELGSQLVIIATAKPGVAPAKLITAIDAELVKLGKAEPPTGDEVARVKAQHEVGFLEGLEDIMARGIQLAFYVVQTGDPDYLAKDMARFAAVTPADVSRVAAQYLKPNARVILTISPAAPAGKGGGK